MCSVFGVSVTCTHCARTVPLCDDIVCDVRQSTLAASVSIGSNLILPLYPKKKKRKMLIDIFYMYSVNESRVWHSPISR